MKHVISNPQASERIKQLNFLNRKPSGVHKISNLVQRFSFHPLRGGSIAAEFYWYGHGDTFCKFANLPLKQVSANIVAEHGNIFWTPPRVEHSKWVQKYKHKEVFVFSDFRKTVLETYGIKATAIGPYIAYANEQYVTSEKSQLFKELFGHIAIHFPVFRESKDQQENECLIEEHYAAVKQLNSLKVNLDIDTIFICIRQNDVFKFRKLIKIYAKKGFDFVSCGGVTNALFLHHQKLLLRMSEIVTSNYFSTTFGYASYLNKQCFLVGLPNLHNKIKKNFWFIPEVSEIEQDLFYRETGSNPGLNGNQDALEFIKDRWGFDNLLSSQELASKLSIVEKESPNNV